MKNPTDAGRCCWSASVWPHWGGFFLTPLSLQNNWFGMTLNVMDLPGGCTDGEDGGVCPGAASML